MNWLQRTLSYFGEPSTKRHVVFFSAISLCLSFMTITCVCAWWIFNHGDLGMGALGALTSIGGLSAGLAGVAYRKADSAIKEELNDQPQ